MNEFHGILPPSTQPPSVPMPRRHSPSPAKTYSLFRDCLRWDFGFTCAFCLLHEADLDELDAEGTGSMWIEHVKTQHSNPEDQASYTNLVFACRFCNRSRGTRPRTDSQGRSLLDPTAQPWGNHFSVAGDSLVPARGDDDAAYTHEAYDLNMPRKQALRRNRRERLEALDLLPQLLEELELTAADCSGDEVKLRELRKSRELARRLVEDVERYTAVPDSAPTDCRCENPELTLPAWLAEQTRP